MQVALSPSDQLYLKNLLLKARQRPPVDWVHWSLQGCSQSLGIMPPAHAQALVELLPTHLPLQWQGDKWIWQAQHVTAFERSHALQTVALALRAQGLIKGWRDELYACWGNVAAQWPHETPELFRLERAAFRYFGLRSHASHVHGITPSQHMWCARRSNSKPTDPGLMDNLAAGGLPADEAPSVCAIREVYEEAGLLRTKAQLSSVVHTLITERTVEEGWHSECLYVYGIQVDQDEQPKNQDGEVSEFLCLTLTEVLQRLKSHEFTPDAACAIAVTALNDLALAAV